MKKKAERFAVALVVGSDPESFVIVGATSDLDIASTHFFSHDELRDALGRMGYVKSEIDSIVRKARENPK